MGIMAQAQGTTTERELIPAGLHRAVCVNVLDLGSHLDTKWNKVKPLVRITFELSDVRCEFEKDGEVKDLPRLIGKQYMLSLCDRANLRKDLQAWRNKAFTSEELAGFDLATLLGVPCMINVEHYNGHDKKQHAGIGSIVGLAQGMQAPAPEGEVYFYSIGDHGRDFPETMPSFLKDKVLASIEMAGAPPQAPPATPPPAPPAQASAPVAPAPAQAPPAAQGGFALDAGAYAEEAEAPYPF